MRRASEHRPAGRWPAAEAEAAVALAFDDRHRRRLRLETTAGEALLLDLAEAVAMADGDGLRCEDGGWVRVRAKPEPVLCVAAGSPDALARLAWHLGNRHTPAEIRAGSILIRPDAVLARMLRGLGAEVSEALAPFQPEGGAYAAGHRHHGHHAEDGG